MPDSSRPSPPPLAYETSAYELDPAVPCDSAPWTPADLAQVLRDRAVCELSRREMLINYYRIGHRLAFALPVDRRPAVSEMPVGISTLTYPWLIWLVWALEERWRILHAAWRLQANHTAGALLQRELAALEGWDHFHEMHNEVGLVTGHIASVLTLALTDETGWDQACLASAHRVADALLDRDVTPWFAQKWPEGEPLTPQRLHNIPVIALVCTAQLARERGHRLSAALDKQAIAVLRCWAGYRTGSGHHTEGTSYDGYLMDSLTGWLATLSQRTELLAECAAAFRSQADQWIGLTLPGRLDLHAPLGDTEPEMPFWISALQRLAHWYDRPDARWLIARIPLARLPAATVCERLAMHQETPPSTAVPSTALRDLTNAVAYRTGWTSRDFTAMLSAPRAPLHHLHHDGGHLVLGWQARFWITDPGYQQYRPGEERTYTLDATAHNAPVINGTAQTESGIQVLTVAADPQGRPHASLDLSRCHAGLPAESMVLRELWIGKSDQPFIVLRDRFKGLASDTEIQNHWLGGAHLAWAFVSGWARLSDGVNSLWLGTPGDAFEPSRLVRHPGSRGPLTLGHTSILADGAGTRWWVLWGDVSGGWTPPTLAAGSDELKVTLPGEPGIVHKFGQQTSPGI